MIYLRQEFVRAILSWRFGLSLFIALLLLLVTLIEFYPLDPTPPPLDDFTENVDVENLPPEARRLKPIPPLEEWRFAYYNAYEAWMRAVGWGFFPLYAFLAATLPYADSLAQERAQKFARYVLLRTRHRSYLFVKFLVNGLAGGLSVALPMAFFLGFTSWKYVRDLPPLSGTILESWLSCSSVYQAFLCDLYHINPDLYIFLRIVLGFVFGIVFATFGMSISAFTNNRYVILFFPFIFGIMLAYGLNFLGIPVFIPLYALVPTGISGTDAMTIFPPLGIIFLCSLAIVALRIKKHSETPY
jgi:hypothetical protein